ncbi:MAG: 3-keto-disaccharide hydrolase [Jejuia sp.]
MKSARAMCVKIIAMLFAVLVTQAQELNPVLPDGWHVHDINRPEPKKVIPGKINTQAPSDAIILFDGKDFNQWQGDNASPVEWNLLDDYMEVVPKTGNIQTKQAFGDIQLHLEFLIPESAIKDGQTRVIGGVFLMGIYKLQIIYSKEKSYSDGLEGAIFGQIPPLVNASKEIGNWQSYDIVFKTPVFQNETLISPAYITVFQNGVLIQNHAEIIGPAAYKTIKPYTSHAKKLPLMLQDHWSPVRYRNIWVREL